MTLTPSTTSCHYRLDIAHTTSHTSYIIPLRSRTRHQYTEMDIAIKIPLKSKTESGSHMPREIYKGEYENNPRLHIITAVSSGGEEVDVVVGEYSGTYDFAAAERGESGLFYAVFWVNAYPQHARAQLDDVFLRGIERKWRVKVVRKGRLYSKVEPRGSHDPLELHLLVEGTQKYVVMAAGSEILEKVVDLLPASSAPHHFDTVTTPPADPLPPPPPADPRLEDVQRLYTSNLPPPMRLADLPDTAFRSLMLQRLGQDPSISLAQHVLREATGGAYSGIALSALEKHVERTCFAPPRVMLGRMTRGYVLGDEGNVIAFVDAPRAVPKALPEELEGFLDQHLL